MQQSIFRLAGKTDTGKRRSHNEDDFFVGRDISKGIWDLSPDDFVSGELGSLLIVADGMGGTEAGEEASSLAVQAVKDIFSARLSFKPESSEQAQEWLIQSVLSAHNSILAYAKEHPEKQGMGTTIVIAWAIDDKVHYAWAGDSRLYKYNPTSGLTLITSDHSLVWEEVKKGKLTPEQARMHENSNIITQSLGDIHTPPVPDSGTFQTYQGDRIMLCSDGLNGMISDQTMENIFRQEYDHTTTANKLIEAALEEGGHDNITVLLLDILKPSSLVLSVEKANSGVTANTSSKKWKSVSFVLGLLVLGLVGWILKDKLPQPKPKEVTKTIKDMTYPIFPEGERNRTIKPNDIDTIIYDTVSRGLIDLSIINPPNHGKLISISNGFIYKPDSFEYVIDSILITFLVIDTTTIYKPADTTVFYIHIDNQSKSRSSIRKKSNIKNKSSANQRVFSHREYVKYEKIIKTILNKKIMYGEELKKIGCTNDEFKKKLDATKKLRNGFANRILKVAVVNSDKNGITSFKGDDKKKIMAEIDSLNADIHKIENSLTSLKENCSILNLK